MNIEDIRAVPITDFLERLGHKPKRQRGNECWYLAPYREERTASFLVNIRKNVWHDFGIGHGGDIFTLAGEFIGSKDFKGQADFIMRVYGGLAPERKTVFRPKENGKDNPDERECMTDIRFGPLYNKVLLRYLEERGICSDVALPNCKEVRYCLHGKRYFAIGFRNLSGGYELRNRFFKSTLSPKDISLIDNGSETCNLFEGFIDCLSWMVLEPGCGDDCLVLNSVALLERSFSVLDRYEKINCYLDRDEAGRRTLETLRKRYGNRIEDCSALYKGFKDLNEYLQNRLPQD
nr:toprim domain-containing protein [Parabacteroides goldsteinii]